MSSCVFGVFVVRFLGIFFLDSSFPKKEKRLLQGECIGESRYSTVKNI